MNNSQLDWVYLAPHLDDAALSCGGLVWEQIQSGQKVSIWTVCAGLVPERPLSPFAQELHARWKTGPEAVLHRREEDRLACDRLGVTLYYFDIPDCIYRFRRLPDGEVPLIQGEADLQGAEPENDLIIDLAFSLKQSLPAGVRVVCPMALGDHIDHRLTRAAAVLSGLAVYYYPDYPYVLRSANELAQMELGLWKRCPAPISDQGLSAWQDSIAAYASQISTFWTSLAEVRLAVHNYWAGGGGRLWEKV